MLKRGKRRSAASIVNEQGHGVWQRIYHAHSGSAPVLQAFGWSELSDRELDSLRVSLLDAAKMVEEIQATLNAWKG